MPYKVTMSRTSLLSFPVAVFIFCGLLFGKSISGLVFYTETLTGDPETLTILCNVTGPDIGAIYTIEIQREIQFLPSTFETVVKMEVISDETPTLQKEIIHDKYFVPCGTFDKTTPNNSYLGLKMYIQQFSCREVFVFRCEMTYRNSTTGLNTTVTRKLSDSVLPIIHTIRGQKNGRVIKGQPASFDINDKLELTCSIVSQTIEGVELFWQKMIGSLVTEEYTGHQYLECSSSHCTNKNLNLCCHLQTTIKYFITTAGAKCNLTFQCIMSDYSDPHEGYSVTIGKQFHAYFSSDRNTKESGGYMKKSVVLICIVLGAKYGCTLSYKFYIRFLKRRGSV
ncbi:uncharacterized protein LOC123561160 [Mercenaria mercenaria]|uniref:uncharacterized protein LOC123561160 n=1 Tax=Mercenaria mercenaria TaxID=6596 RepID=UPI00234E7C67|nr:uncharacterized protein LOC123561160 [Mercenaria mercenaria]